MALNNYTVTLEVREVRILAIELEDVLATSEEMAVEKASSQYERTGRSQFTVELTDVETDEVLESRAELVEEDE
jgi:hypothetical protein